MIELNADNCEQIIFKVTVLCAGCGRRVIRDCWLEFDRVHNLPKFSVDLPPGWVDGYKRGLYCDTGSCNDKRDRIY